MKANTIFASLFATLAAAAPTEKRTNIDLSQLNNLKNFQQVNLNYLLNINSLDLNLLNVLGQNNNFNSLQFADLFQAQQFDLQAILQLQQLQTLIQFGQAGLFNGFDLQQLQLQRLQLGLLNNIGGVNFDQFISPNVVTQVQTVASQAGALGQVLGGGLNNVGVGAGNVNNVNLVGSNNGFSQVGSSSDGAVSAAEQDAQEGASNLN